MSLVNIFMVSFIIGGFIGIGAALVMEWYENREIDRLYNKVYTEMHK